MFCTNCGEAMNKDQNICLNCGAEKDVKEVSGVKEVSDGKKALPIILGIISYFTYLFFGAFISIPFSTVAIVFAIKALRKAETKIYGMIGLPIAIGTLLLSIMAIVFIILYILFVIIYIALIFIASIASKGMYY